MEQVFWYWTAVVGTSSKRSVICSPWTGSTGTSTLSVLGLHVSVLSYSSWSYSSWCLKPGMTSQCFLGLWQTSSTPPQTSARCALKLGHQTAQKLRSFEGCRWALRTTTPSSMPPLWGTATGTAKKSWFEVRNATRRNCGLLTYAADFVRGAQRDRCIPSHLKRVLGLSRQPEPDLFSQTYANGMVLCIILNGPVALCLKQC